MNTPRIAYLRNTKNHPVACLAYSIENETLTFGLSLCHGRDRDKWNRDLGKKIAIGRHRKETERAMTNFEVVDSLTKHGYCLRGKVEIGPKLPDANQIPASLRALRSMYLGHDYSKLVEDAIVQHTRQVEKRKILDFMGQSEVGLQTSKLIDDLMTDVANLRKAL